MKVLLVDDHPLILSALQAVILGLGDDVSVVGAPTAEAARRLLERDSDFDLLLLDLELGDANGFDVLPELRERYPALPIVVISGSDRPGDVVRAIDLGAMGFVPKRSSNDTLFEALRLVMSGGIYVPPMGLSSPAPSPARDSASRAGTPADMPASIEALGLTARQMTVLNHLLQGKPNKLIAKEMQLSVETVKDHVAAVLRALGVNTRTQAVLAVSRMSPQPWKPPAP